MSPGSHSWQNWHCEWGARAQVARRILLRSGSPRIDVRKWAAAEHFGMTPDSAWRQVRSKCFASTRPTSNNRRSGLRTRALLPESRYDAPATGTVFVTERRCIPYANPPRRSQRRPSSTGTGSPTGKFGGDFWAWGDGCPCAPGCRDDGEAGAAQPGRDVPGVVLDGASGERDAGGETGERSSGTLCFRTSTAP